MTWGGILAVLSSFVDMEWSVKQIENYQKDINKIISLFKVISKSIIRKNNITSNDLETWLKFKLNEKFVQMYDFLENFEIRNMTQYLR